MNAHTVLWAGPTNYVIYRMGSTFDITHMYTCTLNIYNIHVPSRKASALAGDIR